MEIPSIKVENEYGDIRIIFKEYEFERPHLFLNWLQPIAKKIIFNFIGQTATQLLLLLIQDDLEYALKNQIHLKQLWISKLTGRWDFNIVEDPNIVLKEIL